MKNHEKDVRRWQLKLEFDQIHLNSIRFYQCFLFGENVAALCLEKMSRMKQNDVFLKTKCGPSCFIQFQFEPIGGLYNSRKEKDVFLGMEMVKMGDVSFKSKGH